MCTYLAKHIRDQKLNGHLIDADDELLETLVKTATKTPASRNATRERKRTRHSDRKSRKLNFYLYDLPTYNDRLSRYLRAIFSLKTDTSPFPITSFGF